MSAHVPRRNLSSRSLTGAQIRAARALLGISAADLAAMTHLGVATIRRAELVEGPTSLTRANAERIIEIFEASGVVMIDANGGGFGVRLVGQTPAVWNAD